MVAESGNGRAEHGRSVPAIVDDEARDGRGLDHCVPGVIAMEHGAHEIVAGGGAAHQGFVCVGARERAMHINTVRKDGAFG